MAKIFEEMDCIFLIRILTLKDFFFLMNYDETVNFFFKKAQSSL